MMSILRWLNSVFLELFYPFAVHNLLNLLIMTRIFAANKLLNKNMCGQAEKNGQQLFCFRPLAYHVILARAQVLSMRTLHEQCYTCDSVCSVDFHRKFKQTTISPNLLIKSWRQGQKSCSCRPLGNRSLKINFEKVVLWHNQVSHKIYFSKKIKNCLLQFG